LANIEGIRSGGVNMTRAWVLSFSILAAGCGDDDSTTSTTTSSTTGMSFFMTSATSVTGNLGGLAGADATCQRLLPPSEKGRELARSFERRTRRRQRQSTDARARPPHRRGPVEKCEQGGVRTISPSSTRGKAMCRCSLMNTAGESTGSGLDLLRLSSTTRRPDRMPMAR
jgi:hypothetical protein